MQALRQSLHFYALIVVFYQPQSEKKISQVQNRMQNILCAFDFTPLTPPLLVFSQTSIPALSNSIFPLAGARILSCAFVIPWLVFSTNHKASRKFHKSKIGCKICYALSILLYPPRPCWCFHQQASLHFLILFFPPTKI